LTAEKSPWKMFLIGLIYSSLGLLVGYVVFKEYASMVMIFLTVLACVPLVYGAIKMEEKKDLEINNKRDLLKVHASFLKVMLYLFLGFVVSFSVWYSILPTHMVDSLFQAQTSTIADINSRITGDAVNPGEVFGKIIVNNLRVLVFCLAFAFFYGFGAIFILTWNASVIGAAVGNFARAMGGSSFSVLPLGLLRFALHGIPEIVAYFMAGLAGGIISIAVIRGDITGPKFKNIVIDSLDLIIGSILLLLIAGLIEVYVTPLVF